MKKNSNRSRSYRPSSPPMILLHLLSFLLFLSSFSSLLSLASPSPQPLCTPRNCDPAGPLIYYPFRTDSQPRTCGAPGFTLSCHNNRTLLDIPTWGSFLLSQIDYSTQTLLASDPAGCLPKLLLSLDPLKLQNSSPFRLVRDSVRNYTFLNCPEDVLSGPRNVSGFARIACLSGSGAVGGHVFWVNSSRSISELPRACEKIKTVSVSTDAYRHVRTFGVLEYTNSLGSGEFNLSLSWELSEELSEHHQVHHRGPTTKQLIVTGLIIGSVILTIAIATVFIYKSYDKSSSERENRLKVENFLKEYRSYKLARYSYAGIRKVTNKFNHQLGRGGYGTVYKGKLLNEIPVAVKILEHSKGDVQSFISEIATIGRAHHVNVVRLIGFCSEGTHRALIYEFMPNGSLEKLLFSQDPTNCQSIGWKRLLEIAVGIARGMEYLHHGCNKRILHFDIKPENILLDSNFNPKISDFGLAKLCLDETRNISMVSTRGTMGYIAPELFSQAFGLVSHKSDVYSFGMLMLEMVRGRRRTGDDTVERSTQVCFPDWIYEIEELGVGPETEGDASIVKKLMIVGLWCTQLKQNDRPSMKKIVQMLERETESLEMPPKASAYQEFLQHNSSATRESASETDPLILC